MSQIAHLLIAFGLLTVGEIMICWTLFRGKVVLACILAGIVVLLISRYGYAQTAQTYTNMPAQCVGVSTIQAGDPLSKCPSGNQKFLRADAQSWVRVCVSSDPASNPTPTPCTYQTMQWQRFSAPVVGTSKVEVCTVAKKAGDPATGTGASCTATGTTGFSAMKQVFPSEVAKVD